MLFRINPNNPPLETPQVIITSDFYLLQEGLKCIVMENFGPDAFSTIVSTDRFFASSQENTPTTAILHLYEENSYLVNELSGLFQKSHEKKYLVTVCENDSRTIDLILKFNIPVCIHLQAEQRDWAEAFKALSEGRRYFSNKILHQALEQKYTYSLNPKKPGNLTARQTEILKKITLGFDKYEIGTQLNLSPHTVQTHRKNLMKKLGVKSVSGLIMHAIKIGLVPSEQLKSK